MCQSDVLPCRLNSNKPAAAVKQQRRSIFNMKLHRVGNVFPAPKSSRGRDHRRQEQQKQKLQREDEAVTPRASGRGGGSNGRPSTASGAGEGGSTSSSSTNDAIGGSIMRRSQSANATRYRSRGFAAGMLEHSMHKRTSHSQEPIPSTGAWYDHHDYQDSQTQELPIPPADQYALHCRGGPSVTVENKNDLTRMYDYATWNMYERIVSARRRRSTELETQQPSEPSSPTLGSGSGKKSAIRRPSESTAGSSRSSERASTTLGASQLSKNSSHDDTSTAATADETDKSSTTSSSWSRTDSPMTYPTYHHAFSSLTDRDVSSCPPPGAAANDADTEDHFIFQLDM